MDVNTIIAMEGSVNRRSLPYLKWSDNWILIFSSKPTHNKICDRRGPRFHVPISCIDCHIVCRRVPNSGRSRAVHGSLLGFYLCRAYSHQHFLSLRLTFIIVQLFFQRGFHTDAEIIQRLHKLRRVPFHGFLHSLILHCIDGIKYLLGIRLPLLR